MVRILLFFFIFLIPTVAISGRCESIAAQSQPRTVLGLYDSRREPTVETTRLHRFFELPLNHMGYVLRYLDVARADFSLSVETDVAGAVSWFDGQLANASDFSTWAVAARAECPDAFSFVVLGETGLDLNTKPDAIEAAYLRRLGLGWSKRPTLLGDFTAIDKRDADLLGFETDFAFQPGRYAALHALHGSDAALRVFADGKPNDDSIDLVVLHAHNAYIHQSATLDADTRAAGQFWIIDPFNLIQRTFARSPHRPIADVTTLNGRRVYFETVGPEGWLAPAPARTFDEEVRLGAENLLADLIAPFPSIPTTVSVVTGDLDPAIGGKAAETGRDMAVQIFALPQVAVATSGRNLVRYWAAISATDGVATSVVKDVPPDETTHLVAVLGRNLREAFGDPKGPAEPQLSDGVRRYGQDPISVTEETTGALAVVQKLAQQKSAPPLFLWSGDGNPAQTVRAAVAGAGSLAIGGGATSLGAAASISALSPFALADGPYAKVYHALPGDLGNLGYPMANAHTLHALAVRVAQTEGPRRLKPFQLAYSAGSANAFGTRSAVAKLKRLAVSNNTIPIFAARYVEAVQGFGTVRFEADSTQQWRVLDRGGLQTVRFDNADGLSVHMPTSEGVLGARRTNGALYIALDPAIAAPLISLIENSAGSGMILPKGKIGLVESNLEVLAASSTACLTAFTLRGWGQGDLGIWGDPAAQYRVTSSAAASPEMGDLPDEAVVIADADGYAHIAVSTVQGQMQTVALHQNCEE